MQQLLRVPLVDVDVAESRRAEEAAVGHGAGGEVDRDRDERGAQRRFHATDRVLGEAEAAGPAEAEAAGPAAVAAGAPAAEAAPAGSW